MSSSYYDVEELIETLVASGMLIFVVVILGFTLLLGIGVYVLQSIALYKMAKKMGHQYPWMAWIPYANMYLMFVLPEKRFRVLAINTELENRSTAFWIYLAVTLGTGVIEGILSLVPFIGAMLVTLLPLLIRIICIFLLYPMYKDLYSSFLDDSQSTVFAIVGLFVPAITFIFLLIASSKEPRPIVQIEGTANYY